MLVCPGAAALNTFEEMQRLGADNDLRARVMIIDTYRLARDFPHALEASNKAIEAYPMVPALKALIAHYRDDADWAQVRPPFMPLPAADADKMVRTLADTHGFRLSFDEAD